MTMPDRAPHLPPSGFSITVGAVEEGALPEGQSGQGLILHTDRGDIPAISHEAEAPAHGVIWVCGARGGFRGPGNGVYAELAEELRGQGITSLRLDYRHPNDLPECVLDTLAGVAYLRHLELPPVALVGHSFGGAVVISAGALSDHVAAVAALSSQTYGTTLAPQLAPAPCWWPTARQTPACLTTAASRFFSGPGSRNGWFCGKAPSIAWRNAGTN